MSWNKRNIQVLNERYTRVLSGPNRLNNSFRKTKTSSHNNYKSHAKLNTFINRKPHPDIYTTV